MCGDLRLHRTRSLSYHSERLHASLRYSKVIKSFHTIDNISILNIPQAAERDNLTHDRRPHYTPDIPSLPSAIAKGSRVPIFKTNPPLKKRKYPEADVPNKTASSTIKVDDFKAKIRVLENERKDIDSRYQDLRVEVARGRELQFLCEQYAKHLPDDRFSAGVISNHIYELNQEPIKLGVDLIKSWQTIEILKAS